MDDNATPALPEDPEALNPGEALPSELEDNGPLPGLVNAAKVEVEAAVTGDTSAEALLAQMGVEDEGLESGQLVGMILAIVVSVTALAFALIYLFVIPLQQQTADDADIRAEYPELATAINDGLDQLNKYRTVDGGYGVPIERAMEVLAAQYDSTSGATEAMTRQEFNTAWIDLKPDGAVRTAGGREVLSSTAAPADGEASDGGDASGASDDDEAPDDAEPIE